MFYSLILGIKRACQIKYGLIDMVIKLFNARIRPIDDPYFLCPYCKGNIPFFQTVNLGSLPIVAINV